MIIVVLIHPDPTLVMNILDLARVLTLGLDRALILVPILMMKEMTDSKART